MLIVDDVYSTGSSVRAVIDQLTRKTRRNLPHDIRIATVWYRPTEKTLRTPDYFVHETRDWLVLALRTYRVLDRRVERANKPELSSIIDQGLEPFVRADKRQARRLTPTGSHPNAEPDSSNLSFYRCDRPGRRPPNARTRPRSIAVDFTTETQQMSSEASPCSTWPGGFRPSSGKPCFVRIPSVPRDQADAMLEVMRPLLRDRRRAGGYLALRLVHVHPRAAHRARPQRDLHRRTGQPVRTLDVLETTNPDFELLLLQLGPILANAMGNLGENFNFYAFSATDSRMAIASRRRIETGRLEGQPWRTRGGSADGIRIRSAARFALYRPRESARTASRRTSRGITARGTVRAYPTERRRVSRTVPLRWPSPRRGGHRRSSSA